MPTLKQEQKVSHTPGPWFVLPDPVWKDRHPLHQARFIATSTDVDVDGPDNQDGDPGGWRFAKEDDCIICTMPDAPNQKQNAALIAAATDLLDACKAVLDDYDDTGCDECGTIQESVRNVVRAAIAKAEVQS